MKNRLKNIWLWLGILSIVMVQLGLSDVHTWQQVGNVLCDIVQDPARLLITALLLVGIYVDPSSPGFKDREKLEDKIDK